jgi:hypothetical protein
MRCPISNPQSLPRKSLQTYKTRVPEFGTCSHLPQLWRRPNQVSPAAFLKTELLVKKLSQMPSSRGGSPLIDRTRCQTVCNVAVPLASVSSRPAQAVTAPAAGHATTNPIVAPFATPTNDPCPSPPHGRSASDSGPKSDRPAARGSSPILCHSPICPRTFTPFSARALCAPFTVPLISRADDAAARNGQSA